MENLENGMLLSKILGIVLSGSGSKDGGKNREKMGIYCIGTPLSHFFLLKFPVRDIL